MIAADLSDLLADTGHPGGPAWGAVMALALAAQLTAAIVRDDFGLRFPPSGRPPVARVVRTVSFGGRP